MPASREFALDDPGRVEGGRGHGVSALICAPNWLGDAVMSLPAIAAFRRQAGVAELVILTKPSLRALWKLFPGVDRVVVLEPGARGLLRTITGVRRLALSGAYILPNSFRSALVPFGAGIPQRRGLPGNLRRWMLTDCITHPAQPQRPHQMLEAFHILGMDGAAAVWDGPLLRPVPADCEAMRKRVGDGSRPWVALLPGAAYGPAKRWPSERFVEVGRQAANCWRARVLLCGTGAERAICEQVQAGIGGDALNLAGETGLEALAALLSLCHVAVANDSGGMHLAAAVGTPVVAIFGITDPRITGPIGPGHRILQAAGGRRSRDLERDTPEARAALAAVPVGDVTLAVDEIMKGRPS